MCYITSVASFIEHISSGAFSMRAYKTANCFRNSNYFTGQLLESLWTSVNRFISIFMPVLDVCSITSIHTFSRFFFFCRFRFVATVSIGWTVKCFVVEINFGNQIFCFVPCQAQMCSCHQHPCWNNDICWILRFLLDTTNFYWMLFYSIICSFKGWTALLEFMLGFSVRYSNYVWSIWSIWNVCRFRIQCSQLSFWQS